MSTTTEQEHTSFAIKYPDGTIKRLGKNGPLADAMAAAAMGGGDLMRVSQDGRAAYPVLVERDPWGDPVLVRQGNAEVIDKSPPIDTESEQGKAALLLAAALGATPDKAGYATATEKVVAEHNAAYAKRTQEAEAARAARAERASQATQMTRAELADVLSRRTGVL